MQAYKRYGVVKGTILTAWRLCRCNPLGMHFFLCVLSYCLTFSYMYKSHLWDLDLSDAHAGGYGYDPPRWFGDEDVPLQ
jgi:hypothetical protein